MLRKFKNFKIKRKSSKAEKQNSFGTTSDYESVTSSDNTGTCASSTGSVRIFLYENDDLWLTAPVDIHTTVGNILAYISRKTSLKSNEKIELWEQIYKQNTTAISANIPVMERKLFEEERPNIMQAILKPEFGYERKYKIVQVQMVGSLRKCDTDRNDRNELIMISINQAWRVVRIKIATWKRVKLIDASTNTVNITFKSQETQCEIEPESFSVLTELSAKDDYQYRSQPDFAITDIYTSYSESTESSESEESFQERVLTTLH